MQNDTRDLTAWECGMGVLLYDMLETKGILFSEVDTVDAGRKVMESKQYSVENYKSSHFHISSLYQSAFPNWKELRLFTNVHNQSPRKLGIFHPLLQSIIISLLQQIYKCKS